MMHELAAEFRASMTLLVLVQGETSKGQLLRWFIEVGNTLLVDDQHLLEGRRRARRRAVAGDYRQAALTSPEDPLLKARMEDCRLRGSAPCSCQMR